jgi:hypothetical protein
MGDYHSSRACFPIDNYRIRAEPEVASQVVAQAGVWGVAWPLRLLNLGVRGDGKSALLTAGTDHLQSSKPLDWKGYA